jgi:HdeA/HdeB family
MKPIIIAALLAVLVASHGAYGAQRQPYHIGASAALSCQEFNALNEAEHDGALSWALGYVSAGQELIANRASKDQDLPAFDSVAIKSKEDTLSFTRTRKSCSMQMIEKLIAAPDHGMELYALTEAVRAPTVTVVKTLRRNGVVECPHLRRGTLLKLTPEALTKIERGQTNPRWQGRHPVVPQLTKQPHS